ncbi:hypothetical protein PUG46_18725 [Erwiniaceae bacterium L1_55_4]|jgi:hypothetical protein|nr:hypothetical protein [Erwiniaceae bacterium L1_55_4]
MINRPVIALLGARGAVGEQVIAQLAPVGHLRAGSRQLPVQRHPDVEYQRVDLFDERALRQFCQGAQLIINCAAPGHLIGDRVARAAAALDCDYLDPGGDEPLFARLQNTQKASPCAVLSAGMLPGLSGLLLRSAFSAFDRLYEAKGYALSCEPFSQGGAADFLASLDNGYGVTGVALRQGELQHCPGGARIQLPLARASAMAYPFMTSEWQRIGQAHPHIDLTWYNLFSSEALVHWLSQRIKRDARAVDDLVALSVRACVGQQPQHLVAVEASGERQGIFERRACVIECSSGAQLTAAVTTFTALNMVQGKIPPGLHFAADVLPATATLQFMQRQLENFCWLELPSLTSHEEGAI